MEQTNHRTSPLEISKDDFKEMGSRLIDTVAEFYETIKEKSVTTGETPNQIETILGNASLPENGTSIPELFSKTTDLLFNHSFIA